MERIGFIQHGAGAPKRLKDIHPTAPKYSELPKNCFFLINRHNEEVMVLGSLSESRPIRQGMMIRMRPEFQKEEVLKDSYLWGAVRYACHVIPHVESGTGLIRSSRHGQWTEMVTPETMKFFEEVRIVKKTDPSLGEEVPPSLVAACNQTAQPTPHDLRILEIRLATYDRMISHAKDFVPCENLTPEQYSEKVQSIAMNMTTKALAQFGGV